MNHLRQSGHLMSSLKISTAGWLIADEESTRRKFAAARTQGVATITGGTPFEIAVHRGLLAEYLDLCADLGADRVECARGFTEPDLSPDEIVVEILGLQIVSSSASAARYSAPSRDLATARNRFE